MGRPGLWLPGPSLCGVVSAVRFVTGRTDRKGGSPAGSAHGWGGRRSRWFGRGPGSLPLGPEKWETCGVHTWPPQVLCGHGRT